MLSAGLSGQFLQFYSNLLPRRAKTRKILPDCRNFPVLALSELKRGEIDVYLQD